MNTAKVIPIHTNDSLQFQTNFSAFPLIENLRKSICAKIRSFHKKNKQTKKHIILSDHQYGFRTIRSTFMAVMELEEEISTAVDNKEYTMGVFIDLKKSIQNK